MTKNKVIISTTTALSVLIAGFAGFYFLVPRYNLSINGEKEVSSTNESGIKKVKGLLEFTCNSTEKDGFHNCQKQSLKINIDTNQKIELFFNGSKLDIKDNLAQIDLPIEKIKTVTIRKDLISKPITKTNTIVIKSNTKDVLRYDLSIKTNFTEKDLKSINRDPTAEEVKVALSKIPTAQDICINSEDDDGNKKLGKPGQYYIKVNFKDPRSSHDGTFYDETTGDLKPGNSCQIGNGAGGSVEVFRTVEDAKKRDDYLNSVVNNNFFGSGPSIRINNSVIRVSDEIKKSSDQKALQEELLNALTK